MPIRAAGKRLRLKKLRALAPLIVAGTFAIAASAATGFEPGRPTPIPESAFQAVVVPSAPAPAASAPALSPALREIVEPWVSVDPAARAQPAQPLVHPIVVAKPIARPRVTSSSGGSSGGSSGSTSHSISGRASYYCRAGSSPCTVNYPDTSGFDAYAAAGPRLRAALGSTWRGRIVYVDGVRVKLIDWCQCYQGQSNEKLLDLYYDVFARVGSTVTIRW